MVFHSASFFPVSHATGEVRQGVLESRFTSRPGLPVDVSWLCAIAKACCWNAPSSPLSFTLLLWWNTLNTAASGRTMPPLSVTFISRSTVAFWKWLLFYPFQYKHGYSFKQCVLFLAILYFTLMVTSWFWPSCTVRFHLLNFKYLIFGPPTPCHWFSSISDCSSTANLLIPPASTSLLCTRLLVFSAPSQLC